MNYKHTIKQISRIGITKVILIVTNLLMVPLLTKFLGPKGFGIWTQLILIVTLLSPFAGLGLYDAIVRFMTGNKKKIAESFFPINLTVLLSSSVFAFFIFALSKPIAVYFFKTPELSFLVKIVALILIIESINSIALSYLRAFNWYKKYSVFVSLQSILQLIFMFIVLSSGHGFTALLLSVLLTKLIITLPTFYFVRKKGVKFSFYNEKLKSYLSWAWPIALVYTFGFVMSASDRFVIGFLLGPVRVGVYSLSYQLASIIDMLWMPVAFVIYPKLSALWEAKQRQETRLLMSRTFKFFTLFVLPIPFLLAIFHKQLILLFSTPEFLASWTVVFLAAIGMIFKTSLAPVANYSFLLSNRTKGLAGLFAFFGLFNIASTFVLVKLFDIQGASLATLLTFAGLSLTGILFARNFFSVKLNLKFLLKGLGSILIMSFILLQFKAGILGALLLGVAGMAVYGIILLLLRTFTHEELEFIKGFICRK